MVQCLASASALGLAVAVAAVLPELPDLACGSLRALVPPETSVPTCRSGDVHASKVLIALLEHLASTGKFRLSWYLGQSHAAVEALQGCVTISGETRPTPSWAFAQADEGYLLQPVQTAYPYRRQHVESHGWLA